MKAQATCMENGRIVRASNIGGPTQATEVHQHGKFPRQLIWEAWTCLNKISIWLGHSWVKTIMCSVKAGLTSDIVMRFCITVADRPIRVPHRREHPNQWEEVKAHYREVVEARRPSTTHKLPRVASRVS